jgi:hypothetical protein
MARYFYQECTAKLKAAAADRIRVKQVKIWETDTTTATYFE